VCGGAALDLFDAAELELLVCGNKTLDFAALERATQYEDGFDAQHPTVRNFWKILHTFDEPKKKRFLKFVTGR
jgi:hypothetical protein